MKIEKEYISEVKEEEIKNLIAKLYFGDFNCTHIEGNIDFCVTNDAVIQENLFYKKEVEYFLWAEAKKPKQKDLFKMFVQLILTIGKSNELRNKIPPKFLGAFNSNKIAFISYSSIQHIFSQNDFNWNVTPSNYNTKEFKALYQLVQNTLARKSYIFDFSEDEVDLKKFIKNNFKKSKKVSLIEITKNNFISVYTRWLKEVKDSIDIDWDLAQKSNILDTIFS